MDVSIRKRQNDGYFPTRWKNGRFFVTVAGLDHEPTPKEMAQIFIDNEMQVVGPPLKIE